MTKKKGSVDVSMERSASSDSRAQSLAKLNAQKILALQAGNTKAAGLIQKIIDLIAKKK